MRRSKSPTASRRWKGGVAWCTLSLVACLGCSDTVSLGSGNRGDTDDGDEIPFIPWLQTDRPRLDDVPIGGIECKPGLTTDLDADGFTPVEGDCNDCDPDVGPNAAEMPTQDGEDDRDENCDGQIDEAPPTCDSGLAIDDTSAIAAARAMDLCRVATSGYWGLARASWVMPDGGKPPTSWSWSRGHGIIDTFGPYVAARQGSRMVALSSGAARRPGDAGYVDPHGFDKGLEHDAPAGFPVVSPSCPDVASGPARDGIALELDLRVPQNAEAFAFDFDFYTYDLPDRFCTPANDVFAALMSSWPPSPADGNIAFDFAGNPITVSTVLLDACSCPGGPPCDIGGRLHACSLGSLPLVGNGFGGDLGRDGDRGATGWLTSVGVATRNGLITLRLTIHDAADGHGDSTVLLDHFRWLPREPLVPKSRRFD